jgi:hypothetical protein
MIKKLIFLSIFLVLALGLMGGAYAGPWSDQLYINGTLTTRDQPVLGGCETAYAYSEYSATCFKDIPGLNSNKWGWTNKVPMNDCDGVFYWPLYAGAGQCDISKGTLVGNLKVEIKEFFNRLKVQVTYELESGYTLKTTHLYVGEDILPKKGNDYTVSPGQFPYKHEGLNGASSDIFTFDEIGSFSINGCEKSLYIVAHAEVCGVSD